MHISFHIVFMFHVPSTVVLAKFICLRSRLKTAFLVRQVDQLFIDKRSIVLVGLWRMSKLFDVWLQAINKAF